MPNATSTARCLFRLDSPARFLHHPGMPDSSASRLARWVPFGIGRQKPQHYRDMLHVLRDNRDNLPYAWKVLSRGVCDGCALGVAGFRDWTIPGVHLCMTRLNLLRLNTMPALDHDLLRNVGPLRRMANHELRQLGRLAFPMRRRRGEGGFLRVSWDEAYALLGDRIRTSTPDRLAFFLTSRGITNETYYVAQKVARFLGTNNVDNAARLCHSPSTGAMKAALGVAASTCSYRDWYGADWVIFFGSNPANDQPVSMKYLDEAKRLGTRIAVVNPFREPGMARYWVPSAARSAVFGTDITDEWFDVSGGGDIAFCFGVLKHLIATQGCDRNFIDAHTEGFEDLAAATERLAWPDLETRSGLPRARMQAMADLLRHARSAVFVWSMGITQHAFGGDAVRMILNLALARGFVGRDKCGVMPIRGHSGVQGGAEMGAYATAFPGGRPVTPETAADLGARYGFPVPDRSGLSATEMVEAAARGELDLLYCVGGNFLRTLPEPDHVAAAMQNVPLRVHQDILLTDQMFLDAGDDVLLLPAQTRYEQTDGGTETTTERRVIFSPEIPRQVGEARAEWRILRDLAAAAAPERAQLLGCDSGPAIRAEIARVVPAYDGIQHLRTTGDQFQYGGRHLCADGRFPTPDGRARFAPVALPDLERAPGVFKLSTRRGKQFNTLIYAETDPLTGAGRDTVLINPDDAAALHVVNGDRVRLFNDLGHLDARVQIVAIARGNLQVHWPEGNVLIRRGVVDAVGLVPDYNADVRIEAVERR